MFTLNKTITAIALCSSLVLSSYALAKPQHGEHMQKMKRMFSQLSVTDTQKQDIRQIMKQGFADSKVNMLDKKAFKAELGALVRSSTWDAEAVEALLVQGQTQFAPNKLSQAQNKHAVWNVLTPEQQAQLIQLKEERKAKQDAATDGPKKGKKNKKKGKKGGKLNLTDAQKESMAAIRNAAKTDAAAVKERLKAFKLAEKSLIQSPDFSAEAWTSLHSQYKNDFLAAALIKTKAKHDSWNVLTPEQQAKAAAKKAKEKKRAAKKGSKGERKNKQKREG